MKPKKFNVGDKVFAKVKGYPAWPAIITHVNKTTYGVRFYGTGEVGACKPNDLFYYLKHRSKFTKNQKRKEYLDAVEEIDIDIAQCGGTDGSEENVDTSLTTSNTESSFNSTDDGSNKRPSSDSAVIQRKKKHNVSETKSRNVSPQSLSKETKTALGVNAELQVVLTKKKPTERENIINDILENAIPAERCLSELLLEALAESRDHRNPGLGFFTSFEESKTGIEETPDIQPPANRGPKLTINDIKIITEDYLNTILAYARHVKKNPELYQNKPMEPRPKHPNELILVKTLANELVGIKYNRDEEESNCETEYERALYDESEANTMLSMKLLLEKGQLKPVDDLCLFETNLDITETQIDEAIELALIESKKAKLQWLKIENKLAELDTEIKKQLGLDKANPQEAAKLLAEMLTLEIEPLMLIKHPCVFDMAKRLRRYVGNVREWNYTEEECRKFEVLAELVRERADAVYRKFESLFKHPDDVDCWDYYLEQVARFKEQVIDMVECNVFALTAPPTSRVAFFDNMEDEEELKIMVDKLGKNKMASTVHLHL